MNDLKTLFEKFNIVVQSRNIGLNIGINCTYGDLGLLLIFLFNPGSIHGQFILFYGSLFVRCFFAT